MKCSGERLPRAPDGRAKAHWAVKPPTAGYDPDVRLKLGPGHHCELFVLARHTGEDIEAGWTFFILTPDNVAGRNAVTNPYLGKLGVSEIQPKNLLSAVVAALNEPSHQV